MVGWLPFVAATLWSTGCSFTGSSIAHWQAPGPACAPTLVCPPVSCVCGSAPAVVCPPGVALPERAAVCPAAAGTSWAALGAAFGAGAVVAATCTWRLQLWLSGGWSAIGRFAVGDARLAAGEPSARVSPPRRPPSLKAADVLAAGQGLQPQLALPSLTSGSVSSSLSAASSPADDSTVWRPRRP